MGVERAVDWVDMLTLSEYVWCVAVDMDIDPAFSVRAELKYEKSEYTPVPEPLVAGLTNSAFI